MSNLKARDLEGVLKAHGVEKGLLMIQTHLIERINDLERNQTELAQIIDKQTDLITDFATIAGNMKDAMESMKPKEQEH